MAIVITPNGPKSIPDSSKNNFPGNVVFTPQGPKSVAPIFGDGPAYGGGGVTPPTSTTSPVTQIENVQKAVNTAISMGLNPYQIAQVQANAQILAAKNLPIISVLQNRSFYGTPSNLTDPNQIAYYNKVQSGELIPKEASIRFRSISPVQEIQSQLDIAGQKFYDKFREIQGNAKSYPTKAFLQNIPSYLMQVPIFLKQYPLLIKKMIASYGQGYLKGDQFIQDHKMNLGGRNYPSYAALRDNIQAIAYPIIKSRYGQIEAEKFSNNLKKNIIRTDGSPWTDPDIQNFIITNLMIGIGGSGKLGEFLVKNVVRGLGIKQGYETYKNPSYENIAATSLFFAPDIYAKSKEIKARRDILLADTGENVPLKNRLSQIDKIIENQGREIETITAKPTKNTGFTNKANNDIDYTYNKKIQFGTTKVGDIYPSSKYFLKGKANRVQALLKRGVLDITNTLVQSNAKELLIKIRSDLLDKGRTSEVNIKKLYELAQEEANRKGRPIATISPKRLRGFNQPEQELIKILPNGYKSPKLNFAGWTESGHRIFTDKSFLRNAKDFLKSKINIKQKQLSYFEELAKDKTDYLKGKKNIPGEYGFHGRKHLLPMEKQNKFFSQHDITKVGDVDSFSKFEHGQTVYDLWKSGRLKRIIPDLYKLPFEEQKKIAQAFAGHTDIRFDLRTIRDQSQLKWYIKNKFKVNRYLEDLATLDRLDLSRFKEYIGKIDYRLLSREALRRMYGSEEKAIRQNLWKLDRNTIPNKLLKKAFRDSRRLESEFNRQKNIIIKSEERINLVGKINSLKSKILDMNPRKLIDKDIKFQKSNQEIKKQFKKDLSAAQKEIIRKQAKHEVNLFEINQRKKFNSEVRDRLISKRENILISQYRRNINQKSMFSNMIKLKHTQIKFMKDRDFKPSIKTKELLDKVYKGKATKLEGKELAYQISKDSGKDYSFSQLKKDVYSYFKEQKYPGKPYTPTPYSPQKYPPQKYPGKPYTPTPYSPQKYPPQKTIKGNIKVIIKVSNFSEEKKSGKRQKKERYFDVFARPIKEIKGGRTRRFIKINKSTLKFNDALDLRDYILDTSLSRTGYVYPTRRRPGKITIKFPNGYAEKFGYKFRDYGIKNRHKVPLPTGMVIKKSQYMSSTPEERAHLSLIRRIRQLQTIPNKNRYIGINTKKK
jgi:hypothetical protein